MYYKTNQAGVICCIKSNDGSSIMYNPEYSHIKDDDKFEWQYTDRNIVRLDDFTFVFSDDSRVLDALKKAKLAELGASFDERVAGSFTTSQGYSMQFDTSDAIKMEGAIKLLEATGATEGYLTQADDTTVYHVPLDIMNAVLMEMMSAFAACHARKQQLRAAINAAQSKEDLDTIEIAWPV